MVCAISLYFPFKKETTLLISYLLTDLLSISDQDTWAYGEALRAMAAQKKFTHLAFSRLQDLVTFPSMPEKLQEISYIANATNFRRFLFNKYGKEDIDIEHKIATDPDTLMTYRGYCRFLESDLQYIFVTGKERTIKGYKRDVKYLAKQMLIRGYVSLMFLFLIVHPELMERCYNA
jgi:pyoverdine/dityrosine biosynthesis protein Dit1